MKKSINGVIVDLTAEEIAKREIEVAKFNEERKEYSLNRQSEYPPLNDLIVALWESVVEERTAAVTELEIKRQAVKDKYPKV